jgi:hypothetical protein
LIDGVVGVDSGGSSSGESVIAFIGVKGVVGDNAIAFVGAKGIVGESVSASTSGVEIVGCDTFTGENVGV